MRRNPSWKRADRPSNNITPRRSLPMNSPLLFPSLSQLSPLCVFLPQQVKRLHQKCGHIFENFKEIDTSVKRERLSNMKLSIC